jgi:hypothetical protein
MSKSNAYNLENVATSTANVSAQRQSVSELVIAPKMKSGPVMDKTPQGPTENNPTQGIEPVRTMRR